MIIHQYAHGTEEAVACHARTTCPEFDFAEQHRHLGVLERGLRGVQCFGKHLRRRIDPPDHPCRLTGGQQPRDPVCLCTRKSSRHEEALSGDRKSAATERSRSHLSQCSSGDRIRPGGRSREMPGSRLEFADLLVGRCEGNVCRPELRRSGRRQRTCP